MVFICKVVGSIDQMEVDDSANTENNSGSAVEFKNNAKAPDSDKAKGKRKLYVGSQALGFRRDNMEVSLSFFLSFNHSFVLFGILCFWIVTYKVFIDFRLLSILKNLLKKRRR